MAEDDPFDRAVAGLLAAIEASSQAIKLSPLYDDERNRAGGLEHLIRTVYQAIDRKFWQEPDFPLFRKLDFRAGYGGDSPDQQYLQAFIRGGKPYRIWGRLGTERLMDIRLYAGLPWAGGRVVAHLNSHDLEVGADGTVEITASPQPTGGNWLANPEDGTEILIRQIMGDWERELPGQLHIDLLDHEGDARPAQGLADYATRIDTVSAWLRFGVITFQDLVMREILALPVNSVGPPRTMTEWQGAAQRARAYAFGHFDLADGDALLVSAPRIEGCEYQGVTINNLWYFTPEYINRQSSLSDRQAAPSEDGNFYFVVSGTDVGAANWLDTTGLRRGLLMFRYDGMSATAMVPSQWPTARKIKLTDVRRELPQDAQFVNSEQRSAAIRARRRGIQLRNSQ